MSRSLSIIWLFGLISGFNIMITGNTLNYWLAKENIALQTIGLLSLITLPYSINFLFAPIFDSLRIKYLDKIFGHRLSWICLTSIALVFFVYILSFLNPFDNLLLFASISLIISFFSSMQDTILSAFRTEIVNKESLGFASGIYIFGYRFGMLIANSGAIYLSIYLTFNEIYKIFAILIFVYLILLIVGVKYFNSFNVIEEKTYSSHTSSSHLHLSLYHSNTSLCHSRTSLCHSRGGGNPVNNINFIKRYYNHLGKSLSSYILKIFLDSRLRGNDIGKSENDLSLLSFIVLILIFLILYRLPDNFINVMINPFLLHLNYDAFEIASVGKFWGVMGAIVGGLIGGFIMKKKNILDSILLFGIIHALAHILFIILKIYGKNSTLLFITIGAESITGGMTMTAYIAFISSLCQGKFRATQYSFFSSMMGISRSIFPIISGYIVVNFGWQNFFLFTTIITIPSLLVLLKIKNKLQQ
ncbi:AmpG family muropeptide MFS transporter [Rickettsia sp. MEAM1 (Bemisia tabaci)]|uniref:AmpG family muropeptide MFS transporter n=1 Tax=unclassified Rickettsia TaxID=114295 RepID=UPI00037F3452|nr:MULTISPECIES: MFS transporter [unclassified Rickettsia]ASX27461.1 AmpG family muropeptide MFS transporter [Rickettsia sp. MEAM1 (Bemisia tabaci)]ODA38095.1 AmpG family muropeptide MFS transporter [Rickettsia sp. wb]ODA38603.1 AmpG family muropeptide MFS transporter [Rickettsia sp. wq]